MKWKINLRTKILILTLVILLISSAVNLLFTSVDLRQKVQEKADCWASASRDRRYWSGVPVS